jgi:hypothetical protein
MSSDNPQGAENQQERLTTIGWVVGFVDGEGCFSSPIYRCGKMTLRWQVRPEFAVAQGASSRDVLEDLVRFFGCGKVYRNSRHDNHREDMYRYCVQRFGDLPRRGRTVLQRESTANFEARQLREVRSDHELMEVRRHLSVPGIIEIAEIAQTMNHRKPSEVLRILRGHTPALFELPSERMRWSGPHGDVGRLANASPPLEVVQPRAVIK